MGYRSGGVIALAARFPAWPEGESDDPVRWLWVHCEGSRDGYRDMERFIGTVRDPGRADRLEIAISGRGAFRRFKDVLARWPGELERWYAFSAEQLPRPD